jgi:hypothetical protein
MGKSTKYLAFYDRMMSSSFVFKTMPKPGLCANLGNRVNLFKPDKEHLYSYWANEETNPWNFNELQQTIVLFLAAMNGEL